MRDYDGPALDGTIQPISEAPYWQDPDGETVDVVDDRDSPGQETTENVPVPDGGERPDDAEGQTTLEDFAGWSR